MQVEVEVRVKAVIEEGQPTFVSIGLPEEQLRLDVKQTAHLLTSGIALLIKSCSKQNLGVSDYELLKEIISHLESEFASITSFTDASADTRVIKTVNDNE